MEAAATLGFPGERFAEVDRYQVDGVYWVQIGTGPQTKLARPVLVENGHVVSEKGYAVGAAWLRRLQKLDKPSTAIVGQMLALYDALPSGWLDAAISGVDDQTGEHGGVTLHPIEIKLVSPDVVEPRPRKPRPTNASSGPSESGPTRGPSGRLGPGPAERPSGGYSPGTPSRARLVEVNGKLTWISESYDRGTRKWIENLREAVEE